MSEETKGYMIHEPNKYIDEISKDMRVDADKIGSKSRFGYFSIAHSSFLGDRFYSQDKQKVYRTEDRKVITEPRGVFTKPVKKGKGPDAFFSNAFKEENKTLAKVKEMADKENEEYMNMVKLRKKGDGESAFRAEFKPSGPKEYKDYYDQHPVRYKETITKEIDKQTRIDKEKHSVITERRGIMTNPPKKGHSTTPGILFAVLKEDKQIIEMKAKYMEELIAKRKRSKSAENDKKDERMAFKPPSMMKNEPFQPDGNLFGEDEKKIKVLLNEVIESKLKGKPKFTKTLPKGAAKQDRPFKPPALSKTGPQSLFKPLYGIPFIGHEKVPPVKHDKDKKAFKKNFTYNRLVDSTVFSPPITSFLPNLKKEFPRIFYG